MCPPFMVFSVHRTQHVSQLSDLVANSQNMGLALVGDCTRLFELFLASGSTWLYCCKEKEMPVARAWLCAAAGGSAPQLVVHLSRGGCCHAHPRLCCCTGIHEEWACLPVVECGVWRVTTHTIGSDDIALIV